MTEKIEEFLKDNINKYTYPQLSQILREEHNVYMSDDAIRKYCKRHGWEKNSGGKEGFEKSIVYGDLHTPFQDDRLLDLFIDQFIPHFKPDKHFIDGDINDWHGFSDFLRNPNRIGDFKNELKQTRDIFARLRKTSPDSDITLIPGNHEGWIERYLWRHPEIASLKEEFINISNLLKLKDYNIKYAPHGIDYHGIYIHHGTALSPESAYSARLSMRDHTCNLIRGHSHRGGVHYKTTWKAGIPKQYIAVESFCMCQLKAEYLKQRPNWQQGWVCIYLDPKTKYFQIQPVCVVDYKFEFEGKMFIG